MTKPALCKSIYSLSAYIPHMDRRNPFRRSSEFRTHEFSRNSI